MKKNASSILIDEHGRRATVEEEAPCPIPRWHRLHPSCPVRARIMPLTMSSASSTRILRGRTTRTLHRRRRVKSRYVSLPHPVVAVASSPADRVSRSRIRFVPHCPMVPHRRGPSPRAPRSTPQVSPVAHPARYLFGSRICSVLTGWLLVRLVDQLETALLHEERREHEAPAS